eukprot:8729774-Pyramimonas_sp.AAC.1
MSVNIKRFPQASKRSHQISRLEKAGGQPAGTYGFQIHGVFGSHLTDCRRRLAGACAAPTAGGCLTTLLELRAPQGDPAI